MTPTANRPDLRRIGEGAFVEVLDAILSAPVTVADPSRGGASAGASDPITSSVALNGQALAGSVHLRLPQAFVTRVARAMTGRHDAVGDPNALLEDAAGELANMVAGRVAARLAADGYPCDLGLPSVSRSARWPVEIPPGTEHGRADLICDGHCLSLEVRCRFASA